MADEPEDYDDDDLTDDDDEEGLEVGVTIEIVGLSLYTHHGVTAEERKIGQRLLLDVRFDAGARVVRVHDAAPSARAARLLEVMARATQHGVAA